MGDGPIQVPANVLTLPPLLPNASAPLSAFIQMLTGSGDVVVGAYHKDQPPDRTGLAEAIGELDRLQRAELGLDLPELDFPAATWAAEYLYRACQLLVCREWPEPEVRAALTDNLAGPRTPATIYSVDLLFRFLPDLHTLADRIAPADALTEILLMRARDWPLSSVGIPLPAPGDIQIIADHQGLFRLYVDRIAARSAKDRLDAPPVRALLRADAGLFPDLLPFPPSAYVNE